ncbi:acyltransferase [Spirosoma sp. KNUC1025]|uniref:acyltransferase family protein n=1 Tax=Spirosoma sp. KNUC1025 TaxID=2894082 RepID=UPI0038691093|nr:acyltransferase [Spirosoma sp. KNUC1025]
MGYIKQLDTLRAIAVIFVIIHHWLSHIHFINKLWLGFYAVNTFFVLSGFLITGILFEHKQKAEALNLSSIIVLKNFYIRRALRIFPIYYLTIFLLLLVGNQTGTHIRTTFPYYLTYTSNFYFFRTEKWDGILSHFWTLAVEEQFYLLWPWLVLFVRTKYLLPMIIGFVLVGFFSQLALIKNHWAGVLPITCFDFFGMGALLAWVITFRPNSTQKFYRWTTIISLITLICFFFVNDMWLYPLLKFSSAIISVWLIAYIVGYSREKTPFDFILRNPILLFIGRISYGLYVYHLMIPRLVKGTISRFNLHGFLPDTFQLYTRVLTLIEYIVVLVLIAWLSYILIEKPFLRLKKYFTYEQIHNTSQASLSS